MARLPSLGATLSTLAKLVTGAPTASELLPVGAAAPTFTVTAHDGKVVDLAALRGHHVVLFFYPKDDTSGCTKEVCGFRDAWAPLQEAGVVVLGVSSQGNAAHVDFADKFQLPFQLLPDESRELCGKYHVPTTFGLAHRVTYLIGKTGLIEHVWPSVKPAGHAAEILALIPRG